MTQQTANEIIIQRMNEMTLNIEVQKKMLSFQKKEDAINWLIKTAVATLVVEK